ncbi:MAG: serine/threonine-protein kinase [Planctomycetota bacterium]
MTSRDFYNRVDALFRELINLPPEVQQQRLDAVGAEDTELQRRVAAMLAEDPGDSDIASDPSAPTGALAGPAESAYSRFHVKPGDMVGRYRLDEEIGMGGMGLVFAATQLEPINRTVALKIVKPGTDTREIMQRFEAERKTLALMEHPNIASVLDAGQTESGLPYFVMELVRGVPITEFCDEQCLKNRDRLRLFGDVCRAVQHAHQKGIIHRDIKPQNVLVTVQDEQPIVKVIDFGVAKAVTPELISEAAFTGVSQLVGTPLYMSPEQAELNAIDIDTRSDIYALGVLLYELLTGTTPIDSQRLRQAAFDEVRRIIREEEPAKPSTRISSLGNSAASVSTARQAVPSELTRQLSGDLDLIVMKALEKDRSRRYETATGFADDIARYLSDEPVLARPPSVAYRWSKFYRRNRSRVVAAATMLTILIAATVFSGISWMRTADALELAQTNEQRAVEQSELAATTLKEVVEEMQVALQFSDLSAQPRRRILNAAARALKAIDKSQHESNIYRRALITTHLNLSDVLVRFGTEDGKDGRDEARQHRATALQLAREWLSEDPNSEPALQEIEFALIRKAYDEMQLGDFDQAESDLQTALKANQQLRQRFPDSEQHSGTLIRIYDALALRAFKQFELSSAADLWRKTREAYNEAKRVGGRSMDEIEEQIDAKIDIHLQIVASLPEARQNIESVFSLAPDLAPRVLYDLVAWYCFDGDHASAAAALSRMDELEGLTGYNLGNNGCGYCKCIQTLLDGREEGAISDAEAALVADYRTQAIECLRQAVTYDDFVPGWWVGFLVSDPDFDPLRDDPRFQRLIEELKGKADAN